MPVDADIDKYQIGKVGDKEYLSSIQQKKVTEKRNIEGLSVYRVPGDGDYLMKVDEHNCPRYGIMRKFSSNSSEYA